MICASGDVASEAAGEGSHVSEDLGGGDGGAVVRVEFASIFLRIGDVVLVFEERFRALLIEFRLG